MLKPILKIYRLRLGLLLACLLPACLLLFTAGCSPGQTQERQSLRIAMPYSSKIQDIDTNYYKLWLEEQTGLAIEVEFIPQDYTGEYLRLLFTSESGSHVDAVLFDGASGFPSAELIGEYGAKGYILPLDNYIHEDSHLQEVFQWFDSYDLRKTMTSADGGLYYMPALDTSAVSRNGQTLWLNAAWLKALKLSMPQTTEELRSVLRAFREGDPNGNGIADEVPLAGSAEEPAILPFNFLINSFVYNDWRNSYMAVAESKLFFAPTTEEWRQAMLYCRSLYQEDLLPLSFSFSREQLAGLANDPRDLVGGFTAAAINDVLFQSSPEVTSRFIQVPPLTGPQGLRSSFIATPLPRPGGVITGSCQNPEGAFALLDAMLSEEASLIGRYGEQGSGWEWAKAGSVSPNGDPAIIEVENFMRNKLQNKTLLEAGPFVMRSKYVDGVAWRGFQADHEYINARAAAAYLPYEPAEYIPILLFDGEDADELAKLRTEIDAYTQEMLQAFITGEKDPSDEALWALYTEDYRALGLDRVLRGAEQSYAGLSVK